MTSRKPTSVTLTARFISPAAPAFPISYLDTSTFFEVVPIFGRLKTHWALQSAFHGGIKKLPCVFWRGENSSQATIHYYVFVGDHAAELRISACRLTQPTLAFGIRLVYRARPISCLLEVGVGPQGKKKPHISHALAVPAVLKASSPT